MTGRTTCHVVLLLIVLMWTVLIIHSLEYVGHFWFHYIFVSIKWLQYLLIALSLYGAALFVVAVRRPPPPARRALSRPFVSIIIPAKNEERVVEGTVRNLLALEYHAGGAPQFEIIVVDDGSTDGTPAILNRLSGEAGIKVAQTPFGSAGKAAALNSGFGYATGSLLAYFDADARVAPDWLAKMVGRLEEASLRPGARVGGIQSRRLPYNGGRNMLTQTQEDEYAIVNSAFQRARDVLGAFVSFAGNGLLVRREALAEAGGWREEALTEDIDLSIRFQLLGWQIRYCEDAVVWEEAVPTASALIRQRSRWFEGGLRCLGEHLPAIVAGRAPLRVRVDMLFFLSASLISTLGIFTTYIYALLRLGDVVVLFLRVPQPVMGAVSAVFLISLIGVVVEERGRSAMAVGGVMVRFALFSLHRVLVLPLAVYRYVGSAVTGRMDWAKTAHLGEMSEWMPGT